MATRKPLVVVSGQVQELPAGDVPAGAEPSISAAVSTPTEKYWRGDKTWRDFFTDVRAATLTGLSTATNAAVAATDTVLAAIGKLQAQVSEKFDKAGGTISGNTAVVGMLTGGLGQTAAFPAPAFVAAPTTHATSRRALITVGSWSIAQDSNGDGVRDFFLYDNATGAVRLRIGPEGNVTATSGALGYGAGAGGSVTQTTSKSTPVYLNKPSGTITMHNASLAAGAAVEFSLNNTMLYTGDGLVVNPDGVTGYAVEVAYFNSTTDAVLRVTNKGATRSDAVTIRFRIFKGALA